jgi:hypothetical protein
LNLTTEFQLDLLEPVPAVVQIERKFLLGRPHVLISSKKENAFLRRKEMSITTGTRVRVGVDTNGGIEAKLSNGGERRRTEAVMLGAPPGSANSLPGTSGKQAEVSVQAENVDFLSEYEWRKRKQIFRRGVQAWRTKAVVLGGPPGNVPGPPGNPGPPPGPPPGNPGPPGPGNAGRGGPEQTWAFSGRAHSGFPSNLERGVRLRTGSRVKRSEGKLA